MHVRNPAQEKMKSHLTKHHYKKTKTTSDVVLSVLRCRLAPCIALVAGFSASVLRLLARGPHAVLLVDWVEEQCRPYWWKDPLFINNFILGKENEGLAVDDVSTTHIFSRFLKFFLSGWPYIKPSMLVHIHAQYCSYCSNHSLYAC